MPPGVPFEPWIQARLKDHAKAVRTLTGCLEDDFPGTFFMGLRYVIQARRGMMARIAKELGLNRAGLYKALSMEGNPSLKTIQAVLKVLDMRLEIVAASGSKK